MRVLVLCSTAALLQKVLSSRKTLLRPPSSKSSYDLEMTPPRLLPLPIRPLRVCMPFSVLAVFSRCARLYVCVCVFVCVMCPGTGKNLEDDLKKQFEVGLQYQFGGGKGRGLGMK